jgi:transcriptional repressor NrdR
MTCPICNGDTKVIDSRLKEDGLIKRRRECKVCKHRFNTYELDEDLYFNLIKGEKND